MIYSPPSFNSTSLLFNFSKSSFEIGLLSTLNFNSIFAPSFVLYSRLPSPTLRFTFPAPSCSKSFPFILFNLYLSPSTVDNEISSPINTFNSLVLKVDFTSFSPKKRFVSIEFKALAGSSLFLSPQPPTSIRSSRLNSKKLILFLL